MGRRHDPRLRYRSPDGRTPGKRRMRAPLQYTPNYVIPDPPEFPHYAVTPPWTAEHNLRMEKARRIGACPECNGESPAGERGPIPVCAKCKYTRSAARWQALNGES